MAASTLKRICVFCGSSAGARPAYANAARALGGELARRGLELVYGGGNVGLMGIVADATLAAGGRVTGVIPRALVSRELAHTGLTAQHVVSSMHERKQLMHDLSDAFIALPGGLGTFEELLETLTWSQLGIHRKPCGLLNVEGFYDPLLALLDHATAEKLVRAEHRATLVHDTTPDGLLLAFARYRAPQLPRWLTPQQT